MNDTCSIEGCEKPYEARGWCQAHYRRWKKHGDPLFGGELRGQYGPTCRFEGCDSPSRTRGWCVKHYARWRKHGDPSIMLQAPDGSGTISPRGYRYISVDGEQVREHRKIMERTLGRPLLPEEEVHHKDGNKLNNEPWNLEVAANHTAHMRLHYPMTECLHGHPWTEENTLRTKKGHRICRACRDARNHARYRKKGAL